MCRWLCSESELLVGWRKSVSVRQTGRKTHSVRRVGRKGGKARPEVAPASVEDGHDTNQRPTEPNETQSCRKYNYVFSIGRRKIFSFFRKQ